MLVRDILKIFWNLIQTLVFFFSNTISNCVQHYINREEIIKFSNTKKNVKIKQLIGEGGFSYVYFCTDQYKNNYAIKKILIQSENQKKSTEKEIELMEKFKSKYILPIIDISKLRHEKFMNFYYQYILLPFIPQGSLVNVVERNEMTKKRMNEKKLFIMFKKICESLRVLHNFDPPYSHRDLKLGNILVDSEDNPLLMDFGSACIAKVEIRSRKNAMDIQEWAETHCTNSYRPPELFDCPSNIDIDQRTDIWSLGCVLYGMAFGKSPFEDPTGSNSVALAVSSGKYHIPNDSEYSEDFNQLLKKLLNMNILERPFIDEVIEKVEFINNKLEKK